MPELVDCNSKQEPYSWTRPEAAHCSLKASQSESCCQATVYRQRGELLPGSSMAAQTPASSSRQDWVCNLPGLELLIRFRPGINVLLCWSNLNTPVSCHCLLLFQKHSPLERKILYHSFIGLKKQILIFTYFSILIP